MKIQKLDTYIAICCFVKSLWSKSISLDCSLPTVYVIGKAAIAKIQSVVGLATLKPRMKNTKEYSKFDINTMFLITTFRLYKTATSLAISIPVSKPKYLENSFFPKPFNLCFWFFKPINYLFLFFKSNKLIFW